MCYFKLFTWTYVGNLDMYNYRTVIKSFFIKVGLIDNFDAF